MAKEPKSSHCPFFSGGSWGEDVLELEGMLDGNGEEDGREVLVARASEVGMSMPRRMADVIAAERRVLVGVALLSREASKPGGGSIYSFVSFQQYGISSRLVLSSCSFSFSKQVVSRPFSPLALFLLADIFDPLTQV